MPSNTFLGRRSRSRSSMAAKGLANPHSPSSRVGNQSKIGAAYVVKQGVLESIQVPKYHSWKRGWELPLAIVIAGPILLLTGLLMVLVRLTSRGAAIYPQERLGLGGKPFVIYKLRTMYKDSEARGAQWSCGKSDPRVTPLGRWLRKLHLDELPQIINVLKGEMSFCGPRPERPVFVEKLVKYVPYYETRMLVRPGITGLAAINLPPDTNLASVERKQVLDLEYIENGGLVMDLTMLGCTLLRAIGVPGAVATWLTDLQYSPDDSRFAFHYQRLHEPDLLTQEVGINVASRPSGAPAEELAIPEGSVAISDLV